MRTILTHVAGVDVHKEQLTITAILEDKPGQLRLEHLTCSTMTEDLDECAQKLRSLGVIHVAMESTGIYWKPVYNVWSRRGLIITLGNAQHIKNVPGRKTDITDSEWIAELHRSGLIRPSYVPEEEFQELRSLTRHRTHLMSDLARVKNRVQRILEDGNVKLASVISDVFGVGGLAVLRAIANKITSPKRLAECIHTGVKAEKEVLRKSLSNCLTRTHCFQVREYLTQYDGLQQCLERLNAEIDQRMQKYSQLIEKLDEIPGVDKIGAQIIVAEATTDMDAFGEDRKFAAWSGVSPGNKRSARKKKELESDTETST